MKKLIMSLLLTLLLTGCNFDAKETSNDYVLPDGLQDCSVYQLGHQKRRVIVVRCPNSQTTTHYKSGKIKLSNTLTED